MASYVASKRRMSLAPLASARSAPVSALRRDTILDVSKPAETFPAGSLVPVAEVSYSYVSLTRGSAPALPHEPVVTVRDAGADSTRSFVPVGVANTVRTQRSSSLRDES